MKKIALLCGGKGSEYSVSLTSAASIINHFPINDYELIKIINSKEGKFFLVHADSKNIQNDTWENLAKDELYLSNDGFYFKKDHSLLQIDVIINMIHGSIGENGILQAILDNAGISYTGCDMSASLIAYDKELCHRLLDKEGILKAKYHSLINYLPTKDEYEAIVNDLGLKMIIKPAREGSSYGISVVESYDEFIKALQLAYKYDQKIIIEEYLTGFEIGFSILEKDNDLICGAIDEIEMKRSFFDFELKYISNETIFHCPARISEKDNARVKEIALKVFNLLSCRDYARIDFFYVDSKIYFNEINTIPGFTDHSRYPNMMSKVGINYQMIIKTLIKNALRRKDD